MAPNRQVAATNSMSVPGISYQVAGSGLLLAAAVLVAWAAIGWAHIAQFNGGAERLFGTSAFADDDYAVALVELPYAGALLIASALAVATSIIGWAVLDRWRRARPAAIILGVVLIAFSIAVFLSGFIARIEVSDNGISDRLYRQSVHQFNGMTSWRLASWFHVFNTAAGAVTIVVVVASWYLLRNASPKYHPAYIS
jgi:hypothetical protein